jgi:hypothetical protein
VVGWAFAGTGIIYAAFGVVAGKFLVGTLPAVVAIQYAQLRQPIGI